MSNEFWEFSHPLVGSSQIVIDCQQGGVHPGISYKVFPVDYGYIRGTASRNMSGGDFWIGSLDQRKVSGVMCTVDLLTWMRYGLFIINLENKRGKLKCHGFLKVIWT